MKKIILIIAIGSAMFSCKKKYNCECSTPDARLGYINTTNYTVKEKNKTQALSSCIKKFGDSGYATSGISCEIK
jgi:uncharacterized protein YxeA